MLKWITFGRGFDSPRLHQPSLAATRKEKAAATKPAGEVGLDFGFGFASYGSARQPSHGELRLGTPAFARRATARHAMGFYYVYILRSEMHSEHFYSGFTEDLDARLKAHNAGQVPHTAKYRPWKIKTAIAFADRQKALDFETYLKTPSGRAFAKKRL